MELRRSDNDSASGEPGTPARSATIGKMVEALVKDLPALDEKALDDAVAEVKERPRISLNWMFDQFPAADAGTRAILSLILVRRGGAQVIDNLNSLVFDSAQKPEIKVAANDLLAELGSAIDPDVFATSVSAPETYQRKLPSAALRFLADKKTDLAVNHARGLQPAERWVLMFDAASRMKEESIRFLEALSQDSEENATAAVSAIGGAKLAAGVPLLLELSRSPNYKLLQKLVKRALFDLRKEGIEVPEEKPEAVVTPPPEESEDGLPLERAMMSATSPGGMTLVVVGRKRPNGRLKVFSVLVDYWKRGIKQAGIRMDVSKSAFDRLLQGQTDKSFALKDASIADCRKVVARGMRAAKELASPLPLDFGMGRTMLGDMDAEVAKIGNPFLCSTCGKELDAETVAGIRSAAPYDNIPAETRCADCRSMK